MISSILKYIWVHLPSLRGLFYRPRKNTYLFLPINGAGLGHLTRSLAIAKRLRSEQPDAEIVFLTTSIGVTLIHKEGFQCHHITPSKLLNADAITWNKLFHKSLVSVLNVHRPSCLVFDGTIPYLGLRRAIFSYPKIKYVWIKRGLYKEGIDQDYLQTMINGFSTVISPGELESVAQEPMASNSIVNMVEPISLLDSCDLVDRSSARTILRLPEDQPCAYVQLGAGNINGIEDVQNKIIRNLKEKGVHVVLGQSPIALNPITDLGADSVIVDYPNSKYFNAFDFAVLAGGYNSVCEAVTLGLPAIFIPNTETGADDQLKRVQNSLHYGYYEVMVEYSKAAFDSAIDRMLNIEPKKGGGPVDNGAVSAAKLIVRCGNNLKVGKTQ